MILDLRQNSCYYENSNNIKNTEGGDFTCKLLSEKTKRLSKILCEDLIARSCKAAH